MDSRCNNNKADQGSDDRAKECNIENICGQLDTAMIYDDEELFKQPPPKEDCPLCFLPQPELKSGLRYMACCGKNICSGCIYAVIRTRNTDVPLCPFCRIPVPTTQTEVDKRGKKRIKAGVDAEAIYNHGIDYRDGTCGNPQDIDKALECWHKAGELGLAKAYCNIANVYHYGAGVVVDLKKANHYHELSAMRGNAMARYNLGINEENAGNMDRALKHHMIAVRSGYAKSLKRIQEFYGYRHATKDDYMNALRSYQTYLDEIKSRQRDEAAAFEGEDFRYY